MSDKEPIQQAAYEEVGDFLWKVITIPYKVTKSIWDVIWPSEEK